MIRGLGFVVFSIHPSDRPDTQLLYSRQQQHQYADGRRDEMCELYW